MKTNDELLDAMQVMFDTYKMINETIEERTGQKLPMKVTMISDDLINYLRATDNINLTRKFHDALYESLEVIMLEIQYLMPSSEEE
tara:strand:- start:568 stop:825 length:258 start_codon:yes stop_codon:yes gene_type:complete